MQNLTFRPLKAAFAGIALAGSLTLVASAQTQVPIIDQIGPSSATLGTTSYASEFFEPSFSNFNVGSIDDFRAPSTLLNLTEVQAAFQVRNGVAGSNTYNNVTSWSVEIYSSKAAAGRSLVGDVASVNLSPAEVTVDTGFGPTADNGALVTLPINVTLPAAGVYYIGVIPTSTFQQPNGNDNGEFFVTTAAFGTTQTNAFISNPGGGFTGLNSPQDLNADLGYRIYASLAAVPEPSTFAMMGVGLFLLGMGMRLRRQLA